MIISMITMVPKIVQNKREWRISNIDVNNNHKNNNDNTNNDGKFIMIITVIISMIMMMLIQVTMIEIIKCGDNDVIRTISMLIAISVRFH
jgi:hypothetical protein